MPRRNNRRQRWNRPRPEPVEKPLSYSDMARSLVRRGLASPQILDPHAAPQARQRDGGGNPHPRQLPDRRDSRSEPTSETTAEQLADLEAS